LWGIARRQAALWLRRRGRNEAVLASLAIDDLAHAADPVLGADLPPEHGVRAAVERARDDHAEQHDRGVHPDGDQRGRVGRRARSTTSPHRLAVRDLAIAWRRQLASWAVTTAWALGCYLAFVGVLYGITVTQAIGGGPLWWPVLVGAASVPALVAVGFTVGTVLPSRYTPPLAAISAFVMFESGLELVHGAGSPWHLNEHRTMQRQVSAGQRGRTLDIVGPLGAEGQR
jgi:hypothetical protein